MDGCRRTATDGGTACGECGATLGTDTNFCPECGAAVGETLAEYCRVCGERFDPDDRFCSDCGTVRNPDETDASTAGGGTDDAENAGENIESFRARVQAYLAEGWELEHDYGDSVVLVDRGWGNLLVHVVLLLFTGGFGNLAYAWYSYKPGAERRRLSADETPAEPAPVEAIDGDDTGGTGRILGGVALLFLGLFFVVSDPLSFWSWVLGLATLAGGLYVFPPTRRRIDRRHPATRFGKGRTTDGSIVSAPGTPCVVCGRPVENGIRRTYREEIAAAGVPVVTTRDGENHYCEAYSMVDPGLDTSGLSVGASGSQSVESVADTETGTS